MLFNWKLFPGTNLQDLNLDWIINFVKMIPSRLPKFSDHHTWLVYDYSTGEYYDSGEPTGGAGEPGEPGKSPIIGTNGNWYTWNTTTETYTDTGTRAQGVQGEPGAGVASGGVAGDVLVKASGVDYNTGWTATPPQMASLAYINAGNLATATYSPGDYLVYNGRLYKATAQISQGVSLDASENGNIELITVKDAYYDINTKGTFAFSFVASGYVTGSGSYVDFYLPLKIKPGLSCAFSLPTGSSFITFIGSTRLTDNVDSITILRQDNVGVTFEAHFTTNQSTYANNQATVTVISINLIVT